MDECEVCKKMEKWLEEVIGKYDLYSVDIGNLLRGVLKKHREFKKKKVNYMVENKREVLGFFKDDKLWDEMTWTYLVPESKTFQAVAKSDYDRLKREKAELKKRMNMSRKWLKMVLKNLPQNKKVKFNEQL